MLCAKPRGVISKNCIKTVHRTYNGKDISLIYRKNKQPLLVRSRLIGALKAVPIPGIGIGFRPSSRLKHSNLGRLDSRVVFTLDF